MYDRKLFSQFYSTDTTRNEDKERCCDMPMFVPTKTAGFVRSGVFGGYGWTRTTDLSIMSAAL